MERKELINQLTKVKKQLLNNSKDSHFAEKLFHEIISIKGQLDVKPTDFNAGNKIAEYNEKNFSIIKTDRGAIFHTTGYSIFVEPSYLGLYNMLCDYVDNQKEYAKLEGEEKELFETTLSAISLCMAVPHLIATDMKLLFSVTETVVKYLQDIQDEAENSELQQETPVENQEFKDASMALETLKDAVKDL